MFPHPLLDYDRRSEDGSLGLQGWDHSIFGPITRSEGGGYTEVPMVEHDAIQAAPQPPTGPTLAGAENPLWITGYIHEGKFCVAEEGCGCCAASFETMDVMQMNKLTDEICRNLIARYRALRQLQKHINMTKKFEYPTEVLKTPPPLPQATIEPLKVVMPDGSVKPPVSCKIHEDGMLDYTPCP